MMRIVNFILAACIAGHAHSMVEMSNEEMDSVVGQGLLVTETISGSGEWSDFNYMRMGLDARVSLNANIDKMQLGCGGFNESIVANSCDIDFDFVRLLGLNPTGDGPGEVGSDFVLLRPYVEIATTGSGANREIVGIKIGSQQADGYFGIGRRYANGEPNLERGGTCNTASGAGNAAGRANCHSGLNSISANLNVELSGQFPVSIPILGTQNACFGNSANNSARRFKYEVQRPVKLQA